MPIMNYIHASIPFSSLSKTSIPKRINELLSGSFARSKTNLKYLGYSDSRSKSKSGLYRSRTGRYFKPDTVPSEFNAYARKLIITSFSRHSLESKEKSYSVSLTRKKVLMKIRDYILYPYR